MDFMASVLRQTGEDPITISAKDLRLLLDRDDGDAALLYLALKRQRNQADQTSRSLTAEPRWDQARLEAAEQVLRELELVVPAAAELAAPEKETRPVYQEEDVAARLEDDSEFRNLTDQVERRLGKKLSIQDLERLLGLYDYLHLTPYVIYSLVCHCVQTHAERYGEGRIPTMRKIEKEGYAWARRGTDTQTAAEDYLKRYAQRNQEFAGYMRSLRLGDRLPVASEEKYLAQWQEWGFPAETVALAYDKTVFRCHEFKWPYCNGILRRWHFDGLHTPTEINVKEYPRKIQTAFSDEVQDREFRTYAQKLRVGWNEAPLSDSQENEAFRVSARKLQESRNQEEFSVSPEDEEFRRYAERLRGEGRL